MCSHAIGEKNSGYALVVRRSEKETRDSGIQSNSVATQTVGKVTTLFKLISVLE